MEKLRFEITINAPVERVWDTMLGDATYRVWTSAFNEGGGWYEGSWERGSKIRFLGPDPETGKIGGMVSEIAENRKCEFLSIRHLGYIIDGAEVTDTPEIRAWLPAYENYTFTMLEGGSIKLIVDMDSSEEYADMFREMWPRGLQKLKEMCEV